MSDLVSVASGGLSAQGGDVQPDRLAELEQLYQANLDAGRPPYQGVRISTRAEFHWIMTERHWCGEPLGPYTTRADFRGANMEYLDLTGAHLFRARLQNAYLYNADLSDADLFQANLEGATLMRAVLNGANLFQANLKGVDLFQAELRGANLFLADLNGAYMRFADLSDAFLFKANLGPRGEDVVTLFEAKLVNADLQEAILMGANLQGADLRGANLVGVRLDSRSILSGVSLSEHTRLGDVVWNSAPLVEINWDQLPRRKPLGDETLMQLPKNRQKPRATRAELSRTAARAYRGLAAELRNQGLTDVASDFRLNEKRMERQASILRGNLPQAAGSKMLDIVAAYGERPRNALIAYTSIVLLFAGLYFALANYWDTAAATTRLTWQQAFFLSVTAFHGRGFFFSTPTLGTLTQFVGAFEAVVGLFIEVMLIATFSRRFLGD